ncbi:phosphoribosyltransferase domain-containing protein [Vibrio neptunius]|uniref:Phosphoribosyltransferase domain-containing protein n=1 Tax=Vibrio neptunius TaxID=170651 RepID=A0ABS3A4J4_9VIBR|nr:phosphoribosyltransferase domain-containing protein [Vibrio neptunius]MBN3493962.1 phosphoribosyltransferase domain-containing protein [Vibrio neptunius]MBN3516458.1 phosphoribosyltransferase domain-containing protein [Vibrio neptunius]MBN3550570.1 phosphoribosyltransferase domain-containing protein [Vibrio neptunius]MBN3578701.1 phosphoribosyltransferase domain-containing protein [Vibrio neptunius]MCH9872366.1 phosphoribosyltransferase domain-containing protein [Vibrio neptunius]
MKFKIRNGTLNVSVKQQTVPLDELLSFASRENPKRGFLFVSKVLGKHLPVKPKEMRASYDMLIEPLDEDCPTFVVGMAETATGLGAGVADSLAKKQSASVYYQHTTRTDAPEPIWFTLDEAHSHAVDHIFYQPKSELLPQITSCQRLVLVDDEISTGRTLKLLGDKLLDKLPNLKQVVIVSLVNWLDETSKQQFEDWFTSVKFTSLLEGSFEFDADSNLALKLPDNVDKALSKANSRKDLGRFAIEMPFQGDIPRVDISKPIAVVGDGEHLYLPFLIAEQAEQQGGDVVFQSTSRSPIMLGDAIETKRAFRIDERSVEHYIYNFDDHERAAVHLIEDESQREIHQFAKLYPLKNLLVTH